jgi:hypothetical protein
MESRLLQANIQPTSAREERNNLMLFCGTLKGGSFGPCHQLSRQ